MVVIAFEKPKVKRKRVVQPLDPAYRYIPLTRGQKALVDAHNYDWLMRWNWFAKWNEGTGSYYAARKTMAFESDVRSTVGMHNVVKWLFGGIIVDHKIGNTLDNRDDNLRRASSQQNAFNHPTRKDNRLGVKGVRISGNRYEVRICVDGRRIGKMFATLDEAKAWRDERAAQLHGEFRRVA